MNLPFQDLLKLLLHCALGFAAIDGLVLAFA